MNLLEGMLQNSTIKNSKGGEYYATTCNANLDLFSGTNRYTDIDKMKLQFRNAYNENKILAVANLLYFLDIREGKGERLIFKTLFKELCKMDKEMAVIVLKQIGKLGRYDYILEAFDTPVQNEMIELILTQLGEDIKSQNPSLLAKWLPSVKTHNKKNPLAWRIIKETNLKERTYRRLLSNLRRKIKLVEHNLTEKDYDINFEQVPTKAMLKYRNAFETHCEEKYTEYLNKANEGKTKINTAGLFCYEIIEKIAKRNINQKLANAMWEQQKDILAGNSDNILVMADTSGSMTWFKHGIETSIGLALYVAERNHGFFKDYYMTFSSRPLLQKVTGENIEDKYFNVERIVEDTNIDKAFELLLNTAKQNNIKQEEMPSHIIIISDMEFDYGVYSQHGTNFSGWKNAFEQAGYKLPKIIFWNIATKGFPVTKYDKDVCMINGYSTSVLENILKLEDFTPEGAMLKSLNKYIKIIEEEK